jgi:hypothetical protein
MTNSSPYITIAATHVVHGLHPITSLEQAWTLSHISSYPPRSFGNTVITPVIKLESTKLTHAPLWEITELINSRVRHVSAEETYKLGYWIAAVPKKSQIHIGFQPTPAAFIATGWHRFPLYSGAELDGPPTFASPVPMEALF